MEMTLEQKAKKLVKNSEFVSDTGFDNWEDLIQLHREEDIHEYYDECFGKEEKEVKEFDAIEKLKASAHFSTFGYSKDYWVDGKYIGSERLEKADRETYGYYGRRNEVLTENKKFKGKPIVKAGTTVRTELFPLNGRIKKS